MIGLSKCLISLCSPPRVEQLQLYHGGEAWLGVWTGALEREGLNDGRAQSVWDGKLGAAEKEAGAHEKLPGGMEAW